jgi:hypothetical protein
LILYLAQALAQYFPLDFRGDEDLHAQLREDPD